MSIYINHILKKINDNAYVVDLLKNVFNIVDISLYYPSTKKNLTWTSSSLKRGRIDVE